MKKTVFTRSIQLLIVALLLLAVLIPRAVSQKLMIASVIIWLVSVTGYYLAQNLKGHVRLDFSSRLQAHRKFRQPVASVPLSASENTPEERAIPTLSPLASGNEPEQEVMLQHIALRITDKLKSAYPAATWKWKTEPTLQSILSGSTHRIIVDDMEKYTHADIFFDKFARIHIEPLILGNFKPASAPSNSSTEDEAEGKEPAVVDVKVWYEMIGQKILQTQITELNSKGHSKLTVKENGDIVIKKQSKELLQTSQDAFPVKNYWQELIAILESDELTGKISGNTLQISWN